MISRFQILGCLGLFLLSSCDRDIDIVRKSNKDRLTLHSLGEDRVFNSAKKAFQKTALLGKTSKEITDLFGKPTSRKVISPFEETLTYSYTASSSDVFTCTIYITKGLVRKVTLDCPIIEEG